MMFIFVPSLGLLGEFTKVVKAFKVIRDFPRFSYHFAVLNDESPTLSARR
jgi:hypothetical protein